MIPIVDQAIETYAVRHASPEAALLTELRAYTQEHTDLPQMMVGRLEGAFLAVLTQITGAKRIVEVGCFTGYSGLSMAAALPEDGRLITCELSDKHADIARSFFDRSPHGHKITIERGPALDTLKAVEGPIDLVFIDADKQNYVNYFDELLPKMRKGGLIVADNVLWSGGVLKEPKADDTATQGILAFNRHIEALADHHKVMLTVRDGMTLVVA